MERRDFLAGLCAVVALWPLRLPRCVKLSWVQVSNGETTAAYWMDGQVWQIVFDGERSPEWCLNEIQRINQ